MKYAKPIVRDLSSLPSATGACNSGTWVGYCYNGGFAGDCNTSGGTTGACNTNGNTVTQSTTCLSTGTRAATCASGNFARA
jgi:hypothetical protein